MFFRKEQLTKPWSGSIPCYSTRPLKARYIAWYHRLKGPRRRHGFNTPPTLICASCILSSIFLLIGTIGCIALHHIIFTYIYLRDFIVLFYFGYEVSAFFNEPDVFTLVWYHTCKFGYAFMGYWLIAVMSLIAWEDEVLVFGYWCIF